MPNINYHSLQVNWNNNSPQKKIFKNPSRNEMVWDIQIKVLESRNVKSQGSEVWITDIQTSQDGRKYSPLTNWEENLQKASKWRRQIWEESTSKTAIFTSEIASDPLKIRAVGKSFQLGLLRHAWSGKILLTVNGESQEIDLFSINQSQEYLSFQSIEIAQALDQKLEINIGDSSGKKITFSSNGRNILVNQLVAKKKFITPNESNEYIIPYGFFNRYLSAFIASILTFIVIEALRRLLIQIASIELCIIYAICILIYLSNGHAVSAGDTIPNTLLTFNLLENHTLNFDIFRESRCPLGYESCYYFLDSPNGHLTSSYPIGTAILTFPIYLVFYAYIKIFQSSNPLDITSVAFETTRLMYEKLAATLVTATTVSIFYNISKKQFTLSTAILSTLIFGFGTNIWTTSSQGLWQHGPSNLLIVCIILFLYQANRSRLLKQNTYIALVGLCCGLLYGIRPTNLVFVVTIIAYIVFVHRLKAIYLIAGTISLAPHIIWDLYYFNNINGAYDVIFKSANVSAYIFTIKHFSESFLGILISPSRGLLIFSPIVLYAIPGLYIAFKNRQNNEEKLICCLTIANFILLASYGFYILWYGGWSYGPRFATDTLPVFCFLINYYLHDVETRKGNLFLFFFNNKIFLIVIFSIFIQSIGVNSYYQSLWDRVPSTKNYRDYKYRIWKLEDSLIERATKITIHRLFPDSNPLIDAKYLESAKGNFDVNTVKTKGNRFLSSPNNSFEADSQEEVRLSGLNVGQVQWHGYKEGLIKGETRVKGVFYNQNNKASGEFRLFFNRSPKPKESSEAEGVISFPKESGDYRLVFSLVAEGVGDFPQNNDPNSVLSISLHIVDHWSEGNGLNLLASSFQ
jgi:hypothetical protein